jgi:8-oxo-dGTP pyrophosphatase MutT (NUDIX family)
LRTVSESGGIVVRVDGEAPRFLVITAKNDFNHWLFPKGKIEEGESAEQAAIRETREEAGIEAKPLGHVGNLEFSVEGRDIRTEYYLLKYSGTAGPGERRMSRWCTYREALELLTFENTRALLRNAAPAIETKIGIPVVD